MASTSTVHSPMPDLKEWNDSVYMFPNSPDVPTAEIIFFHDVLWKDYEKPHVQSWTFSETPNDYWPEVLLKDAYPGARIWYVRYDGQIRKTATGGHMSLFLIAENLRYDILHTYAKNCPVVLVGHGFAGLIIKKLIQIMVLYDPDLCEGKSFLKNVKGIFYFAPPFMGTKLVDSMKDLPSAGSLVKFLEVMNAEIAQLNQWFSKWRSDRCCKATAIFAALPTELEGALSHVVEEGSARYDIDWSYTSEKDHFGVSKLRGKGDSSFHMLTALIDKVIPATAVPIADKSENASKRVSMILDALPQQVEIFLGYDEWQEISKFQEEESRLIDGLTKAGFEETCEDPGGIFWAKCESS